MGLRRSLPPTVGGEQSILPHEPQHSLAAYRKSLPEVQPPPYLAVAFTPEGRSGQVVSNPIEQFFIRKR
jgi:hypothetical protein